MLLEGSGQLIYGQLLSLGEEQRRISQCIFLPALKPLYCPPLPSPQPHTPNGKAGKEVGGYGLNLATPPMARFFR